jgi:hypothetical protein
MNAEGPKDSQQEPVDDSGLQTPQPDQPHPTEAERAEQGSDPVEPGVEDTPEDSPPLEGGDTSESSDDESSDEDSDSGDVEK